MKKRRGAKRGGVHTPSAGPRERSETLTAGAPHSLAENQVPSAIRLPGSRPASGKSRTWYFSGYLYGMVGLEFLTFLAVQATPASGVELLRYAALILTFLDIFALVHLFLWKKWAVWLHIGVLSVSAIATFLLGQFENAMFLALHIGVFVGVLNIGKRTVRQWSKFE